MPAIQYSGYLEFRSAEMSGISLIMSFFSNRVDWEAAGKKTTGSEDVRWVDTVTKEVSGERLAK